MMRFFLPCVCCILLACQPSSSPQNTPQDSSPIDSVKTRELPEVSPPQPELPPVPDTTELEHTLIRQGLVNMASVNPTVIQNMMYSTEDNFMQADVYGDFDACYLQVEVAERLSSAQQCLQEKDSLLSIIVFDCVRPRSVQFKMWEIVKDTDQRNYVAAPTGGGSMHNYGAAVDLGLWHQDSGLVDMGTSFDFFGELAQPRYEDRFLKSGQLSAEQVSNRRTLRACMLQAGFHGILSEWWHFVGFPRKEVRQKYQIVE
ncbi:MAG: M15 family metallopeptidase [Bacteroidota bacterium]